MREDARRPHARRIASLSCSAWAGMRLALTSTMSKVDAKRYSESTARSVEGSSADVAPAKTENEFGDASAPSVQHSDSQRADRTAQNHQTSSSRPSRLGSAWRREDAYVRGDSPMAWPWALGGNDDSSPEAQPLAQAYGPGPAPPMEFAKLPDTDTDVPKDHPAVRAADEIRWSLKKSGLPTRADGVRVYVSDGSPLTHGAAVARSVVGPSGLGQGSDVRIADAYQLHPTSGRDVATRRPQKPQKPQAPGKRAKRWRSSRVTAR